MTPDELADIREDVALFMDEAMWDDIPPHLILAERALLSEVDHLNAKAEVAITLAVETGKRTGRWEERALIASHLAHTSPIRDERPERKALAAEIVAGLVAEHRTVDDLAYEAGKEDEQHRIRETVKELRVNKDITWADDEPMQDFVLLADVLAAIEGMK